MTLSFDVTVEEPSIDVVIEQPVVNVEVTETVVGSILVDGPPGIQGPVGPQGIQGPIGPVGPSAQFFSEVIADVDSISTSFLLTHRCTADMSVQVFRNGLAEVIGIGFFVETSASTTAVTFTTAPLATDVVSVTYQI